MSRSSSSSESKKSTTTTTYNVNAQKQGNGTSVVFGSNTGTVQVESLDADFAIEMSQQAVKAIDSAVSKSLAMAESATENAMDFAENYSKSDDHELVTSALKSGVVVVGLGAAAAAYILGGKR